MSQDRRRDLLAAIERASKYRQTAFVHLYEAQLRALDSEAPAAHQAPTGDDEGPAPHRRRPF